MNATTHLDNCLYNIYNCKMRTIYSKMYIEYTVIQCPRLYNLFERVLETGRKASLCRDFLSCFEASQMSIKEKLCQINK